MGGHEKPDSQDSGKGPKWEQDGQQGSGHGSQTMPGSSGDGKEQK
ncbi:hypothetical protein SAMN02745673_01582 [Marinactinospora thermotolerans DSM 45154]|uniref:Uncharacterized protein n=1 Tax=Marinactinospora thermotolerans DSM 45154 TaxID=1122192 RepID=A0A1T4NT00_9ACTN|nr:hypothetical protein SAMN02745673_01582 [Marinactinospora thermotolerans DSM 45154]